MVSPGCVAPDPSRTNSAEASERQCNRCLVPHRRAHELPARSLGRVPIICREFLFRSVWALLTVFAPCCSIYYGVCLRVNDNYRRDCLGMGRAPVTGCPVTVSQLRPSAREIEAAMASAPARAPCPTSPRSGSSRQEWRAFLSWDDMKIHLDRPVAIALFAGTGHVVNGDRQRLQSPAWRGVPVKRRWPQIFGYFRGRNLGMPFSSLDDATQGDIRDPGGAGGPARRSPGNGDGLPAHHTVGRHVVSACYRKGVPEISPCPILGRSPAW